MPLFYKIKYSELIMTGGNKAFKFNKNKKYVTKKTQFNITEMKYKQIRNAQFKGIQKR